MREDVLQALAIDEKLEEHSIQIVSLYAKGKQDYYKLQVMCQIVLLMDLQLSRCVCNHSAPMHQNATKSNAERITVQYEIILAIW